MFFAVLSSLTTLVPLINSGGGTVDYVHAYRSIERIKNTDSSTSLHLFDYERYSSNVSYQYDNSDLNHDFLLLDNYHDRVYFNYISDGGYCAYLEWYVYRVNNGEDFYFSFNSVNLLRETFNLRVDFNFFVNNSYLDDDIYFYNFSVDFSSQEFVNSYNYSSSSVVNGFNLEQALYGLLNAQVSINYIPLSENEYNMYDSYNNGYDVGYGSGYDVGVDDGYSNGYQNGYIDGYNEGASQDATAVAIFSGIISVGLIPINFFLACLNFEVFGINIGAFVSALLTIAIVVIITRMIINGGSGGDK